MLGKEQPQPAAKLLLSSPLGATMGLQHPWALLIRDFGVLHLSWGSAQCMLSELPPG